MMRPLAAALALAVLASCAGLGGLSGDEGADVPSRATRCSAVDAPPCGPHGTCVEAGDLASCVCQERYAGPTCGACAAGFQDDDGNGTCEPICGTERCRAHELCELSSGAPTCVCAPGYERAGEGCAWKGALKDPAFQDDPKGAWTLEGGAQIDPAAAGVVSPGLARVPSASCSGGRVRQRFAMPAVVDAEPLALELASYRTCSRLGSRLPIPCFGYVAMGLADRTVLGGFVSGLPPSGGTATYQAKDRLCLGDRAFVPTFELAFQAACGISTLEAGFDHAAIVSAPECPMPGEIPNGNFEGAGGWQAVGSGAEIAASGGNNGSRAGHVTTSARCEEPTLAGWISPRTVMPRAALVMTVKGTTGKDMNVTLVRGGLVATVRGTNVFDRVAVCLPEWTRGLAWPLNLTASSGTGGSCADPIPTVDFLFDDLAIATDASCPDPAWVIDGGFESKSPARPWTGAYNVVSSATGAHAGGAYASISAGASCAAASMTQLATVPDPSAGAGGPMLRYWYKASANAGATTGFSGGGDALDPAPAWTQRTKCLDPKLAGRPYSLVFTASGSTNCTSASLSVDDVEIVHDPSCPP